MYRVIHASLSDIYRSRFHPISAVLLTPTPTLAQAPTLARTGGSVSFSALLHRWLPRWFYLEENLGFWGHCYILWGGLDPHGQKWSLKQNRPWPLLHLGRWARTRNIKTRIPLLLPHSATPCQWSSQQSGPMTVLGWCMTACFSTVRLTCKV